MADTKPKPISPSQLATAEGCLRKWAYSRVRPRTDTPATIAGTRIHGELEEWAKAGKPPPADSPATLALEYLPMPGQGVAEPKIEFEHEGLKYHGFVDLVWGYVPGESVVITDYKTTGNLRWAKTPEQLDGDAQRIVYGYWAGLEFQVRSVVSFWLYLQRNKPHKAKPVFLTREHARTKDQFQRLHETWGLAIASLQGLDPADVPRTGYPEHCRAFGGCQYRDECLADVSPADRAWAVLGAKK